MRLQFPTTISNSSSLQEIIRFASTSLEKIQSIINGNVDLIDNGNNVLVNVTLNKINTDFGVSHSLGRVPRGFILVGSDNPILSLANGKTPNSSSTLYLQSGSTGTVTVMVF